MRKIKIAKMRKMNKRGDDEASPKGAVIIAIIAIAVLAVVLFFIFGPGKKIANSFDLIPTFGSSKPKYVENVQHIACDFQSLYAKYYTTKWLAIGSKDEIALANGNALRESSLAYDCGDWIRKTNDNLKAEEDYALDNSMNKAMDKFFNGIDTPSCSVKWAGAKSFISGVVGSAPLTGSDVKAGDIFLEYSCAKKSGEHTGWLILRTSEAYSSGWAVTSYNSAFSNLYIAYFLVDNEPGEYAISITSTKGTGEITMKRVSDEGLSRALYNYYVPKFRAELTSRPIAISEWKGEELAKKEYFCASYEGWMFYFDLKSPVNEGDKCVYS